MKFLYNLPSLSKGGNNNVLKNVFFSPFSSLCQKKEGETTYLFPLINIFHQTWIVCYFSTQTSKTMTAVDPDFD